MIRERIKAIWNEQLEKLINTFERLKGSINLLPNTRNSGLVIGISLMVALLLWVFVNLSQSYILTLNLDLQAGEIADDMALREPLPKQVLAEVESEGWLLLRLAIRNPALVLDLSTNQQSIDLRVPLNDAILDGVQVLRVEPVSIKPILEKRLQKRVPVLADLDLAYKEQFYPVGELQIQPDSVTISGASSIINDLRFIKTQPARLAEIDNSVDLRTGLVIPDLIETEADVANLTIEVLPHTEVKKKVPIELVNIPDGMVVDFNPQEIEIRYDIPVKDFTRLQKQIPFSVQIDYSTILNNINGFLIPELRKKSGFEQVIYKDHLPKRIRYYKQVP